MRNFYRNNSGATAIEYGLICAVLILAVIGGMTLLGSSVGGLHNNVAANVIPNL